MTSAGNEKLRKQILDYIELAVRTEFFRKHNKNMALLADDIITLISSSNQQLLRELEAKQDAYYLAHDGEGEAKMVAGLSAIIQDKLRSTDNAS